MLYTRGVSEASSVAPSGRQPAIPTAKALLLLTRPRGLLWFSLLPLIGYMFALWDYGLPVFRGWAFLGLLVSWTLLNAGTMWLNAELDRDEGAVLFGDSVPVPAAAGPLGYVALALSWLLALALDWRAGVCAGVCCIMAIAYSHRRTQLKGHPFGGPLINALGYGVLSPLAGWVLVAVPPTPRAGVTLVLLSIWMLGVSFAAQAFQAEEDGARGYRTLVVTHGPRVTLTAARVCMNIAVAGVFALAALGYYPRVMLLALPFFVGVDRHFIAWIKQPNGGSPAWAVGLLKRSFTAGLIMMTFAYGEYWRGLAAGEPTAGLGTARGAPSRSTLTIQLGDLKLERDLNVASDRAAQRPAARR